MYTNDYNLALTAVIRAAARRETPDFLEWWGHYNENVVRWDPNQIGWIPEGAPRLPTTGLHEQFRFKQVPDWLASHPLDDSVEDTGLLPILLRWCRGRYGDDFLDQMAVTANGAVVPAG